MRQSTCLAVSLPPQSAGAAARFLFPLLPQSPLLGFLMECLSEERTSLEILVRQAPSARMHAHPFEERSHPASIFMHKKEGQGHEAKELLEEGKEVRERR